MTNVVSGELAPAGGHQQPTGPSGPLRIVGSGRTDPQLTEWRQPCPERLWERLDPDRRAAHERLVASAAAAQAQVRDLTGRLQAARVADERTLQNAIKRGRAPGAPTATDIERELAGAQERAQELVTLVEKSGRGLVAGLSDGVLDELITDAKGETSALITAVPGLLEQSIADLSRAGALGSESTWLSRLKSTRRAQPYRPRPNAAPPGIHLAAVARLLQEARRELEEDARERAERHAPPVRHASPSRFAPESAQVGHGPSVGAA
jgi:hypothetical protein